MVTHHVHPAEDPTRRGWRRWECDCGWSTEWTLYTQPSDGALALVHQITGNREETP